MENRVQLLWPVLNLSLNVSKQMRRRIVKDRRCFDIRNAVTTSALIDDVEHVFFTPFFGK
jgi:hypothetical protein